jgi:two-component system chemotaxis response regulator CheY
MRSITRSVLATIGPAEVREARNGREALEMCESFRPELVLCDWNMPEMDGVEFVRAFRRTDETTPIIMISTENELSRMMHAIKAGVNHYVVKPFSPAQLRRRIHETMSGPGSGRAAA